MPPVPPEMRDVLEHADYPVTAERLLQLAGARGAPDAVRERLDELPRGREFEDGDEVRSALPGAAERDLSDWEQTVLETIAAVRAADELATVETVAARAGLETDAVEQAVGLLTDRDLIREHRVEETDGATGVGRHFAVKSEPHPPGS